VFPCDNRAFALAAERVGAHAPLAQTTDQLNRSLLADQAAWVGARLGPGARLGILGLAYKPDTQGRSPCTGR
jgi:UDP-glucose 6-dehydrogenase